MKKLLLSGLLLYGPLFSRSQSSWFPPFFEGLPLHTPATARGPEFKEDLPSWLLKNVFWQSRDSVLPEGKYIFIFIVDTSGRIRQPELLRPVSLKGSAWAREMERRLLQMPSWQPGTFKARKVPVRLTLPLTICAD